MAGPPQLICDPGEVTEIAASLRDAELFALDLEFASESRYVPELALVQVAWGVPDEPRVAAIDPLETDPRPVLELIGSDDVSIVVHAAKQDLSLLAARFSLTAANLWDSQIGAAFAGHGEQVGYARLIDRVLGIEIDKSPQYTDWMRRPLSDKQLAYAIDDVRHLIAAWSRLSADLQERGRLQWVQEESKKLAAGAATRPDPDVMYQQIGGWRSLRPKSLGSLRALAAWRERVALDTNKPPSWILPDGAMMDLCKRNAATQKDLRRARGVGPGTVRRYGQQILDQVRAGADDPPELEPRQRRQLSPEQQSLSAVVASLVASRCAQHELPVRFIGGRSEAEALVASFFDGEDSADAALLSGWRRQFVGDEALSWLRGEIAVAADPDAPGGLGTIPVPSS